MVCEVNISSCKSLQEAKVEDQVVLLTCLTWLRREVKRGAWTFLQVTLATQPDLATSTLRTVCLFSPE